MNEHELLELCRQGDHTAFAQLVGQHRHRMWAVSYQITGSREDAEDAIQNALTAAWQNLHTFRGNSQFGTWIHRTTANAALTVIRRRREATVEFDDTIELDDNRPLTADRVVTVDAVRRALADLPDDFREAIVLREFADMTYQEIADHQGINVQTVRSRISRARARLVADLAA